MYLRKLIILILCTSIYQAAIANASNDESQELNKIIIYYYEDKSETDHFRYYSYVIPDSIAADLKGTKRYQVKTFPVTIGYIDESAPESEYLAHIRILASRGKEFSSDYVIIGTYYIEKKRIFIKTQIFSVRDEKIVDISESSTELGVLLFSILDKITEKINRELDKAYPGRETLIAKSPFIPLYHRIGGMSFGINFGTVQFMGDWGKLYDSTDIISVYMNYELTKITSLKNNLFLKDAEASILFDYFNNDPTKGRTSLSVWGVTLNYIYLHRLSESFLLTLGAGFGGTKSELIVRQPDGDGPGEMFLPPQSKDISYDPCLNLSIAARIIFDPVVINTGVSYRRIFYSNTPMMFSVIFFGFGYRI
jgi:TolB-like protein